MEETTNEQTIEPNLDINVKFRPSAGDGFDYKFDPGQLTVRQLKERLVSRTTIPADSMRLVYSGRVLKDEDMVDLYGEHLITLNLLGLTIGKIIFF
jgi:ubiquilin